MRIPIPSKNSIPILDTAGTRKGASIQNVSAADVYYSDDQRLLDSVDLTNLPTVGHLLPGGAVPPQIVVYPAFVGRLYGRAQGSGAALEVLNYEIDLCR